MKEKVVEIANECGMTGLKRVVFYIIAPFIAVVGFVKGFVMGLFNLN